MFITKAPSREIPIETKNYHVPHNRRVNLFAFLIIDPEKKNPENCSFHFKTQKESRKVFICTEQADWKTTRRNRVSGIDTQKTV